MTDLSVGIGTPKAGRREWIGLGVIAIACVLYVMDLTILHLAVPEISRDLRPTSAQLLWIIDIYGFMVAGSLITMGALGDRIGRRRLLMIGAGAFGVASVLAALSTSAEMLIATRALLGLAGATLAPSTLSLIRNMFLDDDQRRRAIAVWITSFSVGGAIGPLLGGLVLEFFWWGAAFLLAVPVMALLLILGPKLLPEYRDPSAGRPDVVSAALSLAAILSAIFGIKQIAENGWGPVPAVAIGTGGVIGALFVRRQRRLQDPFLDLRLFAAPGFSAALATYGLGVVIAFGGFLFLPQYLQLVLGLSPLTSGLWMLPWALAFVVGSQLTPRLASRVSPAYLMAGGFVLAGAGFLAFTGMDEGSGFPLFLIGSLGFSLGLAPVVTLTIDIIVGVAPPERAGAASAVAETAAEFGGAIGIASFGSLGVALYRRGVAGGIPEGLAPRAIDVARDTLGGAVEIARQLPDVFGSRLLDAARDAFIQGLHWSAALSAVGSIALGVLVLTLMRRLGGVAPDPNAVESPEPIPETLDPATAEC